MKAHSHPKLQVRVSSTLNESDFKIVEVNNESEPTVINNEFFSGYLSIRIQNFDGITPSKSPRKTSSYFEHKKRLFSVQTEGRFKNPVGGEELVLAADFNHPLNPPFVISPAIKFAQWVDPTLHVDLKGTKPSVWSYILCAINSMCLWAAADVQLTEAAPGWKWRWADQESPQESPESALKRRNAYNHLLERQKYSFNTETIYGFDWYSPYVDWNVMELRLVVRLKAQKYLNKQPVRFYARTKDSSRIFYVVEFDLIDNNPTLNP